MAVIGYTRVSHTDQVEGASLDAQKAKIETYCDLHALTLAKVYSDEGISAKDTAGRPAAQEVLELIRAKKIDGVIIFKLDRLVRNTKDAIEIAELCKVKGVALHSICEKIDTDSAIGEFFFTLMAALAQLERKQIGERTAAVLQHKRKNGEKTGGDVPYGYDVVIEGDGDTAVKRLVQNKTEQKAIKLIGKLRTKGHSLRAIGRELERRSIFTKRGKAQWHPRIIQAVLLRTT
jgi:site-specific DNA recombinase